MFYWLYSFYGVNIFHYITVRALIGFFIGFALTLAMMPSFIRWAKAKKMKQPIYALAPESHQGKKNTPTMGGLVFMSATLAAIFLSAKMDDPYVVCSMFLMLGFMAIGVTDDMGKITNKKNDLGLSARGKLYGQFFIAFIVSTFLFFYMNFPTSFYMPFLKNQLFDMGYFAIPFWALVIVAASNAVNITDGLDGLATVPSVFAFFSLGVLIYITGNAVLSSYLFMPKVIGVGELAVVAFCMIGALLGFLWYNSNPAEVFMGDSGSLPIGALLGFLAIASKSEILLIMIGFVFVMETMSVIIQIASYKSRGKRVFLMAPLHHHFEMKKWAENKIIVRFWIIALLSNIIALLTIKIR
jgi:phospho-N-acetylmuramoyl-pentapeptide-transferase